MNVLSSHEGISLLPVPDDSGQVLSDHCRTLGVSDDDPHEINLENQRYGSRSRVASLPCHVIVPLYKRLFSLTSCPNQSSCWRAVFIQALHTLSNTARCDPSLFPNFLY